MRKTIFGIFMVLLAGCKNFETKKVSSEEILHQKLQHFSWTDVDVYPAFENCRELMEKPETKRCFEKTLAKLIYDELSKNPVVLGDSIQETVVLHLLISAKGSPKIDSVAISNNLRHQLPKLETRLHMSVDNLPKIHPATTRGIPVATKFSLPIRIVSE